MRSTESSAGKKDSVFPFPSGMTPTTFLYRRMAGQVYIHSGITYRALTFSSLSFYKEIITILMMIDLMITIMNIDKTNYITTDE